MKGEIINIVKSEMLTYLNAQQMERLDKVLEHVLWDVTIVKEDKKPIQAILSNTELVTNFLDAKNLEGCSAKTIKYYRGTINKMLETINKSAVAITTDDLRKYLSDYQKLMIAVKLTSIILDVFFPVSLCGWKMKTTF